MIRRVVPYPVLALALFIMWLLLAQSISPGQLLLGLLVALIATWSMAALRAKPSTVKSWRKVVRLLGIVAVDILRSNIAVARIVLSGRGDRTSSFISLQLKLRDEQALTILALIITATPGTAWVQFDRTTRYLIIHVFDLVDEEGWVRLLKTRYEAVLMEIFEP